MTVDVFKKAPSLQHAVRKLGPTPEATAREILIARDQPIPINTFRARIYIMALLKSLDEKLVTASAEREPKPHVRKAALEILPLISEFMLQYDFRWIKEIPPITVWLSPSVFSIANPLGVARLGDKLCVFWPQTWKNDSLNAFQFNLIMTIMKRQFIDQYEEYNDVAWVELSAPAPKKSRELTVRTLSAARMMSDFELNEIGENLEQALTIVEATPKPEQIPKKKPPSNQGDLGF